MEREFVLRNSLLTDLFAAYNIRAIYNIFLAILILLVFNSIVHDFFEKGRSRGLFRASTAKWKWPCSLELLHPIENISYCFQYLPLALFNWLLM